MDSKSALAAFQALSQETRLDVVRLLLRQGPDGMAAGDIADHLSVRQNTLSAHLSVLAASGLVRAEREGRVIRYRADLTGIRGLIGFLIEDCCGGHPARCQPLLAEITCPC